MSSWVDNQVQEAFQLYRRYLAMSLHFRSGSAYDYTLYSGATNITLASFKKKGPKEINKFIGLKNQLMEKSADVEQFLFANARYGHLSAIEFGGRSELNTGLWIYDNWKTHFGNPLMFDLSVKNLVMSLQNVSGKFRDKTDVVVHVLEDGDQKWFELISLAFQSDPDVKTQVIMQVGDNALMKIGLDFAIKVQKMYSYFCII